MRHRRAVPRVWGPEAIQLADRVLVLETQHDGMPSIYRNWPDLCFDSAAEIVERIHALDRGVAVFERERYADLVHFTPPMAYNVIRDRLGLARAPTEATVAPEIAVEG